MSDIVIYLSLAVSLLVVVLLVLTLLRARRGTDANEANDDEAIAERRRRLLRPTNDGQNDGPVRRRQRQNRVPLRTDTNDEELEDEDFDSELPVDKKIGKKKRLKMEAKEEKRHQRERDLQEREERKERQKQMDEMRLKEEQKVKEEEAKLLEAERSAKEEKEKQELEEYLKLKESFAVEEEGFDEDVDESESQNKLQTFIEYIKNQKVVLMEELAGHFHMKIQDVIQRVQDLLAQELIVGVIDDRGKFIYITKEELQSVAKFVRQRGRVSIAELVESSNSLINLQPNQETSVAFS
ncbi:DDRGK domain-containing protein 1-like [Oppia nitens]|uniref:DDRGK domain-containing protein 1-like n=1 Tax=Oppia nitens TaxID=1686743 RepID=UPI0023DB9EB8|nr:DDRGK domain-containing protein 1-like [Oppia nitens]